MYMISSNIQEFNKAKVEFETLSLTEKLDEILFPSIVASSSGIFLQPVLFAVKASVIETKKEIR